MLTTKELNAKIGGIRRTTASLRANIQVVFVTRRVMRSNMATLPRSLSYSKQRQA